MASRRDFITKTALAAAAITVKPFSVFADMSIPVPLKSTDQMKEKFNLVQKFGLGGVAAGNGWHENPDSQIQQTFEAAWKSGVRYFDTSPFYGFGLSERRLGHFLFDKQREEYVISSKVGRIFEADRNYKKDPKSLWFGKLNFKYKFDYTANGVRRSVEDSLQRLGLASLDIVFVHDLSPDTPDLGSKWKEQFAIAAKGAFPELTKMREEGLIKGWGLGVNTPDPILEALKISDPDVMLVATQYSLVEHSNALNNLFPEMEKKNVKAIIGAPLNGGFLAGRDKFNYGPTIPPAMIEKRNKIEIVAKKHEVDLKAAALQFAAAHPVVSSIIPGASKPEQATANAKAMQDKIPAGFWVDLKKEKLIEQNAPVPNAL